MSRIWWVKISYEIQQTNIGDIVSTTLTPQDIKARDEFIEKMREECGLFLKTVNSKEKYSLCEGFLDGLDECEKFTTFEEYLDRIKELTQQQVREYFCSVLEGDEKYIKVLREKVQIYNPNEKTDFNELAKMIGKTTQIGAVYDFLKMRKVMEGKDYILEFFENFEG